MSATIFTLSECLKAYRQFEAQSSECATDYDYCQFLESLPFGLEGDVASAADAYGSGDAIHYHQNLDARIESFVQHFLIKKAVDTVFDTDVTMFNK